MYRYTVVQLYICTVIQMHSHCVIWHCTIGQETVSAGAYTVWANCTVHSVPCTVYIQLYSPHCTLYSAPANCPHCPSQLATLLKPNCPLSPNKPMPDYGQGNYCVQALKTCQDFLGSRNILLKEENAHFAIVKLYNISLHQELARTKWRNLSASNWCTEWWLTKLKGQNWVHPHKISVCVDALNFDPWSTLFWPQAALYFDPKQHLI